MRGTACHLLVLGCVLHRDLAFGALSAHDLDGALTAGLGELVDLLREGEG